MLLAAQKDLDIDLSNAVMIGDTESDIGAARAANCKAVLLSVNGEIGMSGAIRPDHVSSNLYEAVLWTLDLLALKSSNSGLGRY